MLLVGHMQPSDIIGGPQWLTNLQIIVKRATDIKKHLSYIFMVLSRWANST